ncbi:hypothetical protein FH968_09655 [Buttiauxella sp. B2]|uniref:helix-turn-helix domain-containing protein n=1 Tax=Buttiauxella sp. B2 TaxID=2587812 RepID=UPI0011246527|nr:helix-turn-helix domain-containing protein [Buttiauxella sp. B2]TNV20701.1 hypothetical protein FH968_09655 [Buttiauxella sp. B2]
MGNVNDQNSDAATHSIYPPRPIAEIAILQQALSTLGTEHIFHPRDEIYAVQENEKSLYLFNDGHFTFLRASDGLVLSSGQGGMIYGIAECLRPRGGWYLKVGEPCMAQVVKAEEAFEVFTKQQLWEPVASLLAWYLQIYSLRDEHLFGVTAYVMIRNKLLELHSQPPGIRSGINVADYIQERTQLSRSTIMAILGELRRGNYVEIKRGKLVDIKYLPKEY